MAETERTTAVNGDLPVADGASADGASADGASTLRKISLRLLPLFALGYGVAIIDRGNIGFAALQMNRDLHFSASVYGFGAGLFSLGYALCEIPSNLALYRFGARRWIARIMFTWGLLAMSASLVKTPIHLYSARFLLGMAEAGFFPGIAFYLMQWFPAEMRARAISRFYIAAPLAIIANGLLAGPVMGLGGRLGLRGWQWLFLLEGFPAVVLSVVFLIRLPDSPESAPWLTAKERIWLAARLKKDLHAAPHLEDNWGALRDARVWQLGLAAFLLLTGNYAYTLTAPTILREVTGFSITRVGMLMAFNGLLSVLSLLFNAMHSDRVRERRWHIAVPSLLVSAAFLASGLTRNPAWVVPAFAVATAGFFSTQGIMFAIPGSFLKGKSAAVGIAVVTTMGILGGFAGPAWMGWMKDATGGYQIGLMTLALPGLVAATMMLWLKDSAR